MNSVEADELIEDLDPDQRAAVTSPSHLVAVIAGAGSGKTRVLTRRVAYRVATGDADARHTLVLTFTREAAGELRRRLHRLGLREHVEAGTFHSVMLSVLRQRWSDTDRRARTVVPERRRLLREALDNAGGSSPRDVESALYEIDWAMARGVTTSGYASTARRDGRRPAGGIEQADAAFVAYEQLKRKRGVIDFDDVLTMVLREAESDTEFGDALRWRFRHLLVDEAQDLNPVQHRLIDMLRAGRDDVFLVGDPSQAIFGFNGADPRLLVDVESTFPGVEVIRLPLNHRCTPQIVAAGRHALTAIGDPPEITARRHDGAAVSRFDADDELDEAQGVATQIARGDPNLVRSGSVAVLARTNAQLAAFETPLGEAGVETRRRSNAAGDPITVAQKRATDLSSPSALRGWAHDTLDDLEPLTLATARLEQIEQRMESADGAVGSKPASLRVRRPHPNEIAEARFAVALVEAERRVAGAVLEFLRDQPRGDGAELRAWIATTNPFGADAPGGVELLTFHAAKGREWHSVFVTGVETSLVPHRSATTAPAKAEEARLLYVALTRASDELVITSAGRRAGYERKVSPFIADLDLSEPELSPPPRELLRRTREASPIGALKRWRLDAARRANVLPAQLVSDRDLSAIARKRPLDAVELAAATTMGTITAERLAPEILDAMRSTN